MFLSRSEPLADGRGIKFVIEQDSSPMSYAAVIHGWQNDFDFRDFFIGLLKGSPFPAFRWETPPVTVTSLDQVFEFVLLYSPEIALDPDHSAFAEHFATIGPGEVVEFPNLGGDAILVVPGPGETGVDFGHFATFLRNSSEPQQHGLMEMVGAAMQRRVSSRPVWLNTAGGGVAWLHVRLDDRPKYYAYAPYRHAV